MLRWRLRRRVATPGRLAGGCACGRDARRRAREERAATSAELSPRETEDRPPLAWWDDVRAILRFALPALGSSLASPVLSAVDTAVIGRCASTLELAALGPSSTVFDSLGLIFAFLQVASINKLAGLAGSSGNDGEADSLRWRERRKAVSEFALLSLIIGTVLMTALILGAPWLMSATTSRASSDAVGPAVAYIRIRALSLPAFIGQITMQGTLMGLSKDAVTPLFAVLISGLVNTIG